MTNNPPTTLGVEKPRPHPVVNIYGPGGLTATATRHNTGWSVDDGRQQRQAITLDAALTQMGLL